jgi:hypothetical protein
MFPDVDLTGAYILPQQEEGKARPHLLGETLQPHLKFASSSHNVLLNGIECFILVTFKSHIPKSEVYELGDSHYTLSMYCVRYIRIMSEDVHVLFNTSDLSELM